MKLEDFKHLIDHKIKFDNDLELIERLTGIRLIDSNLITDSYNMFDAAIALSFTEEGQDLVFWWLYEDVDKVIYINIEKDLFTEETEDIIPVRTPGQLWSFFEREPKLYFKNV